MGDSPFPPAPEVVNWIYSFQPSGRSLATFLGDVNIKGQINASSLVATSTLGNFNPIAYGADPTGATDSSAAFVAACTAAQSNGGQLIVSAGNYSIQTTTSLACPVVWQKAAFLTVSAGVTFTFAGGFSFPFRYLCFQGAGTVKFASTLAQYAFPEWFGAQIDTSGFDCAPAINKALSSGALLVTLAAADYWLYSGVQHVTPFVKFLGAGSQYEGSPGQCTRLVNAIATPVPSVLIGAASQPAGGPNNFPRGLEIGHIYTSSGGYSVAPAPGNEWTQSTCGFSFQFCNGARVYDLQTAEFGIGFKFTGNVYMTVDDCGSFRSFPSATKYTGTVTGNISGYTLTVTASTITLGRGVALGAPATANTVIIGQLSGTIGGAGTYLLNVQTASSAGPFPATYDPFWGFALDGRTNIGLAGGNASLYLHRNNTTMGGTPVPFSIGLYALGLFQDTFIRDFETSELAAGYLVTGVLGNSNGNYDLHIEHAVLDQCSVWGGYIENCEPCSIEVSGGYIAVSNNLAVYGMALNNVNGAVNVHDMEILGQPLSGNLYYNTVYGLQSYANRLIEGHTPTYINQCGDSYFRDTAENINTTAGAGITVGAGSSRGLTISGIIRGSAGAFTQGINILGTGMQYSECHMTSVDSVAIQGNSANKLVYNGTGVLAAGPFGTGNQATGVIP